MHRWTPHVLWDGEGSLVAHTMLVDIVTRCPIANMSKYPAQTGGGASGKEAKQWPGAPCAGPAETGVVGRSNEGVL